MTAPAIPTSPAELEDWLSDGEKIGAALKDGSFKDVVKAYAQSQFEQVSDGIKAETQKVMAQWLKDQKELGAAPVDMNDIGKARPGVGSGKANAAKYNPTAPGAVADGTFKDKTEFFQAIWHNADKAKFWNADLAAKVDKIRNWSETVPSEGGFMVPEEFRSELLRLSLESSIVRSRARVIPMAGLRLNFPMVDSTTNNGSLFGGIQFYWTEEGAELVESEAKFGSVKLEANKLTGLAHVPNELVRDWAGFEAFLSQVWPEAMTFTEDVALLKGNGVGQPLGAIHEDNPAMIVVPAEAGQAASTVVWENVIRMYARLLPSSLTNAAWIVSPDVFVELATMALNVGTGGSAVWLTDAHGTPVLTLLGLPVLRTEKAPGALGSQGDISLVDFGYYLIGDRQSMEAMSSPHVKFTSDKTSYRIIERLDGAPWLQSPIEPENGSATLSPFVQLGARA